MKKQGFAKKAVQASAWYLRLGSFALSLVMGFSFALYPILSREARPASQTAFDSEITEVDYKAILKEPDTQNQSVGASISRAELKALLEEFHSE